MGQRVIRYQRQIFMLHKKKKKKLQQPDKEKTNTEDGKMSSFGSLHAAELVQGFQVM